MIYVMGGGGEGHQLVIHAPNEAGATVTATLKDSDPQVKKTALVGSDGTAVIKGVKVGTTWIVQLSKMVNGSKVVSSVKEVTVDDETVELSFSKTYGIKRVVGSSSTDWTRTGVFEKEGRNLPVGVTAYGAPQATDSGNAFDNCYPWSDIERVPIGNDIMVKIPKFYFKRYAARGSDGQNYEHIEISDYENEADNFKIHPAFNHNGKIQDCIYVGAYKTSNSGKNSASGQTITASQTRQWFRNAAWNKNSFADSERRVVNGEHTWSLIDITTHSAIAMLMMVEFASSNLQQYIGQGYVKSNHTAATKTGLCDALNSSKCRSGEIYYTGTRSGSNEDTNMVYRGIEDFWGNIWEFTDGINMYNGNLYICNVQGNYADSTTTNYTQLSFTCPSSASGAYITAMGLDEKNPAIFLPSAASSGSATTYWADGLWSATGEWKVCLFGGLWNGGSWCGPFCVSLDGGSGIALALVGARLLAVPN